jgi:hypothetical protein
LVTAKTRHGLFQVENSEILEHVTRCCTAQPPRDRQLGLLPSPRRGADGVTTLIASNHVDRVDRNQGSPENPPSRYVAPSLTLPVFFQGVTTMAFIVHPLMRPMPAEAFLSRGVMLEWDAPAEAELIPGGTVELIRATHIELALVEWVGTISQEPEDPLPVATIRSGANGSAFTDQVPAGSERAGSPLTIRLVTCWRRLPHSWTPAPSDVCEDRARPQSLTPGAHFRVITTQLM